MGAERSLTRVRGQRDATRSALHAGSRRGECTAGASGHAPPARAPDRRSAAWRETRRAPRRPAPSAPADRRWPRLTHRLPGYSARRCAWMLAGASGPFHPRFPLTLPSPSGGEGSAAAGKGTRGRASSVARRWHADVPAAQVIIAIEHHGELVGWAVHAGRGGHPGWARASRARAARRPCGACLRAH